MSATAPLARLIDRLLAGELTHLSAAEPRPEPRVSGVVLAGSFNPLHHGHLGLGAAARSMVAGPIWYELSVQNVDKPPLPAGEVLRRAAQFAAEERLLLSNAPTFWQKAELYPGATFVIGYDTAVRLFEPRYYADEADMLRRLRRIEALGCRFLAAGRQWQGEFRAADEAPIPVGLRSLITVIPAERFRADVSSTELRSG